MRLGVDIGGTTLRAGLVKNGKLLSYREVAAGTTREAFLRNLISLMKGVARNRINAVGIGCPGPGDYQQGIILETPNIPIRNFKLKDYIQSKTGWSVVTENDAVCFALGEWLSGAAKNHRIVVGITLGTGVGGGIILDGKPFKGVGNAGHFCKMVLSNEVANDNFFKYKTFEVLCSERGLLARAPGFKSGKELHDAARKGDKRAIEAFREFGHDLGLAVGSIVSILDPEIVVIGGGLSRAWKLFEHEMRTAVSKVTLMSMEGHGNRHAAEIVPQANEHSAVIGASSLL